MVSAGCELLHVLSDTHISRSANARPKTDFSGRTNDLAMEVRRRCQETRTAVRARSRECDAGCLVRHREWTTIGCLGRKRRVAFVGIWLAAGIRTFLNAASYHQKPGFREYRLGGTVCWGAGALPGGLRTGILGWRCMASVSLFELWGGRMDVHPGEWIVGDRLLVAGIGNGTQDGAGVLVHDLAKIHGDGEE